MMVSEFPSQRITGGNNAPEFDDDQDPVMDDDQPNAKQKGRWRRTPLPARPIGSPVVATDDDNDTLTYTLTDGRLDAEHFDIDWATGQILTKGQAGRGEHEFIRP